MNDSRAVGVLLLLCTVISLILANMNHGYRNWWSQDWLGKTSIPIPRSFSDLVNNFLMSFFFLMAGMEIKRELREGELSTFKKAVLPFGAALGGMLVPALIFATINRHGSSISGWGIPTATDIAFSLGVASLLGKRVPLNLKILLMALAIIDDLGAIVIVALFYGSQIHWIFLGLTALIFAALMLCNRMNLKFGILQILLGFALWYAVFNSGIEASISGVLFAFTVPVKNIPSIGRAIYKSVNFIILPLFALANTAILVPSNFVGSMNSTIGLGIITGLVVGKPIGIFLFSRVLVFFKMAHLPSHTEWKDILGMGTLAGIGFTMSIFTTMLAYNDQALRDIAKIAILASVVSSVVLSFAYFRMMNYKLPVELENAESFIPMQEPELQLNLS